MASKVSGYMGKSDNRSGVEEIAIQGIAPFKYRSVKSLELHKYTCFCSMHESWGRAHTALSYLRPETAMLDFLRIIFSAHPLQHGRVFCC